MANPMHITGIDSAQACRVDDAGFMAPQNAGLDVRTGVAWGPGAQTLVTGNGDTAPMSVWVGVCNWFSSRGVANGPYRGAAESVRTVPLAAAPASGSRIDVVYAKALDNTAGVPSPDGSVGEQYAAVTGTSSTGTPVKPALPVGAEELATVTISAGATSTNGSGVVIANTARLTVARGARIPVRSQAERDALTAFKGLEVYRLDTGQVQLYSGSAWVTTYDPAAPTTAGTLLNEWETAAQGGPATPTTETLYTIFGTYPLTPGVAYSLPWEGRLGAGNTAVLATVRVRAKLGGNPDATSPMVSGTQKYLAGAGGPFQEDVTTGGRPFQVTNAGTYTFGLFCQVPAGSTATLSTLADLRNIQSLSLYTHGPAPSRLRTI